MEKTAPCLRLCSFIIEPKRMHHDNVEIVHKDNIYLSRDVGMQSNLIFQIWKAGVLMDAINVLLLVQCLSNRDRTVYRFTIDCMSVQRSKIIKC